MSESNNGKWARQQDFSEQSAAGKTSHTVQPKENGSKATHQRQEEEGESKEGLHGPSSKRKMVQPHKGKGKARVPPRKGTDPKGKSRVQRTNDIAHGSDNESTGPQLSRDVATSSRDVATSSRNVAASSNARFVFKQIRLFVSERATEMFQ